MVLQDLELVDDDFGYVPGPARPYLEPRAARVVMIGRILVVRFAKIPITPRTQLAYIIRH